MSTPPKFCVNCVRCKIVPHTVGNDDYFIFCQSKAVEQTLILRGSQYKIPYLVTGKIDLPLCSMAREDDKLCGESGKYYHPIGTVVS